MNRRELLAMAGVLGLAPSWAPSWAQARQTGDAAAAAAARDAWLYALPLIEMATARARMLKMPGAAINALNHSRTLTDHTGRAVTTPNNDTLYSTAFLDLTKGPVTLTIPVTGTRYYSVAVMDMFTNNNVVLGTRTVGGEGGTFTLVGPGHAATGPNPTRIATAVTGARSTIGKCRSRGKDCSSQSLEIKITGKRCFNVPNIENAFIPASSPPNWSHSITKSP